MGCGRAAPNRLKLTLGVRLVLNTASNGILILGKSACQGVPCNLVATFVVRNPAGASPYQFPKRSAERQGMLGRMLAEKRDN